MPRLVDTHAHLFDERFRNDLPQVLERATAVGVERIVAMGIDLATSIACVEMAARYPTILASVGIQPNHVAEANADDWQNIERLATTTSVVAIGETGLDRYWDRAPFALQEEYFARHLELARRLRKPVVIHCREAEADVVRMLKVDFEKHGLVCGIMHSYSGDAATAKECLALGLHLSFAGMITYKTADALREIAKEVPLDKLLVETDCPYLSPVPMRGKRNEPAYVLHTATQLALDRKIDVEELCAKTADNALRLFGMPTHTNAIRRTTERDLT